MRGSWRASLYRRELPLEMRQLDRLVHLARDQYANVAFVALFGSIARLEPHADSDTDLLLLCHDREHFFSGAPVPDVRLLIEAEISPLDQRCRWSFSGVVSDRAASDLDEDFLGEVARDGVLLYQQSGYTPPAILAHLVLYMTWQERVRACLARCERTLSRAGRQTA